MHFRKPFGRVFLISLVIQMIFFGFFVLFGTNSSSHALNAFGDSYLGFYYPAIAIMMHLPESIAGQGEAGLWNTVGFGLLAGALVYSSIAGLTVVLFREVRRSRD